MNLKAAQEDLRRAHVNGGTGVLVSGLVWLIAGLVWLALGPQRAFVALFIGGMAIAPVAQAVSKFVFKAPPSTMGKRLEWIAIATVPILLAGFYVAWKQIDAAPDAAIPLVAIAVGVRYLTFPIMFGRALFAALGGAFIALGWLTFSAGSLPTGNVAILLGLIELGCAALLCRQWRAAGAAR